MKLLVIEDDERIAQLIQKGLRQERHVVDVAFDAADGLARAASQVYQLIICDVMLPDKSGVELTQILRSKGFTTPILLLTALSAVKDVVKGLDAGADDYLTKPFAFDELYARVRALSRRQKNVVSENRAFAGIELDAHSKLVRAFGREVSLTHKEYVLLQYFVTHPGVVISKQTLLDYVWEGDGVVSLNTVEVTVKNLRRKVFSDVDTQTVQLKTMRGFGYQLTQLDTGK